MSYGNRFHAGAGRMALENTDGQSVEADGLDIDTQHGDGADAALLELQSVNTEVVTNDNSLADLENTTMALESLLESAEAAVETGGLDPLSAEILTKAVNNETAPLGTAADEIVPGLESFKNTTDRRQATAMAVESIKDWIAKVWAKIKEYIAKGRDLAKKLYIKVKQAVQGLQRRIAGLKKDLENRDEKAKKAGQVETTGQWDVAGIKTLVAKTDDILKTYNSAAISAADKVAAALSANDAPKAAEAGGTDEAGATAATAAAAKKEFVVPSGLSTASLKVGKNGDKLPGGYVLLGEAVGFSVQKANEAGGSVNKATAAPLSFSAIEAHLKELEGVAKEVVEFERDFQKRDEAARKVSDAGDKFAAQAKKEAVKGTEAEVRAAVNAAKDSSYLLDKPIRSFLSYSATAINGFCSTLAAHIGHYDKK